MACFVLLNATLESFAKSGTRMRLNWGYALIPLACVALMACHPGAKAKGKAPTGQVVATVDGDEITTRELRAELGDMTFPDAKSRKLAEQAALEGIISRKLLAKAAIEAELDKTPDFAVQKERANELLLAQALQKKLLTDAPPPTREEATSFVNLHPDLFSERKIYTVDQIRIARPTDPATLRDFEPLKTMEDIEKLLIAKKIEYQRATTKIDALAIDPRLIDQIIKLPPGEVFVVPGPDGVLINRIEGAQTTPFAGEPAIQRALAILKQQRNQDALSRQFTDIQKKAAGKIQFNKAYQPAPPPAAVKPGPPAAPAAPVNT